MKSLTKLLLIANFSLLTILCLSAKSRIKPTLYKGIDVSKYQGDIDWKKVKKNGTTFAYAKATEGVTIQDKTFSTNLKKAKKEGVKFSAYHFFRFHVPASAQLKYFINTVDMNKLDMIPALDVEENNTNRHRGNVDKVRKNIRKFLQGFEKRYHVKMVIYTNQRGYERYIKGHFDDHPLWICSIRGPVTCVDKCHIWQYSHTGKVKGIQGHVDMNRFMGTQMDWVNLAFNDSPIEDIGRTDMDKMELEPARLDLSCEGELSDLSNHYGIPLPE